MASRVNTRFVLQLGAVLVLIAGVVAYFGVKALAADGERNIREGDEAMAAGDINKAVNFYGRAVNKDRGRKDWLVKWLGAIEKSTPTSYQAYLDAYWGQYRAAQRAMCETDRRDAAPFKKYLEEAYQYTLRAGGSLKYYEELKRECEDMDRLYQGDAQGHSAIRRYRGLAISGMFPANPDLAQTLIDQGLTDLDEALKVDPKDRDSIMAAALLEIGLADRLEKANRRAEADALYTKANARLDGFLQAEPGAQRVAYMRLTTQMNEIVRVRRRASADNRTEDTTSTIDVFNECKPRLLALYKMVMDAPPEQTDVPIVFILTQWAPPVMPESKTVASDVVEHASKGHADDPVFLLAWASLEIQRGAILRKEDPEDLQAERKGRLLHAIELSRRVATLPDKPVSLEGALLFDARVKALRVLADASFALWEQETDPAKRQALLAGIEKAKKDLTDLRGKTEPSVLSIEARLAVISGDTLGGRTLVTRYNDMTQRRDTLMLMIEAELLIKLGEKGAAKSVLEQILRIQPQNLPALYKIGILDADMRDFKSAAAHLGLASSMLPDNQPLRDAARNAAMLANDTSKADPVLDCLFTAAGQSQNFSGDLEPSIKTLRDCLGRKPGDERLGMKLAEYLVLTRDFDGAKKVLDEVLASNPDAPRAKKARADLDKDPFQTVMASIDSSGADEIDKLLMRYGVSLRFGKTTEARAHLDEAIRKAPEAPHVVEILFENAISQTEKARDDLDRAMQANPREPYKAEHEAVQRGLDELDRLLPITQKLNLDRVDGVLYQARVMVAKHKSQDAIGALREVVNKDKLNLFAWRLLGVTHLEVGNTTEAIDALRHAVAIKPDDVVAINGSIRALTAAGRFDEALEFARRSEPVAAHSPDFADMLLSLEAEAPGGDRVRAIAERQKIVDNEDRKKTAMNRPNRVTLAWLYLQDKKFDQVQKLVESLKSDPSDPIPIHIQASVSIKQGKLEEGMKVLNDYIQSLPEAKRTEEVYIVTARLLQRLGELEAAKQMLISGRPRQSPSTMLIDCELGDMMFNLGKSDDALDAYRRAVDAGVKDEGLRIRKRMLEACLRSNRFDDMNRLVAALPAAAQSDGTILILVAESAAAQKDRDKALKYYDQAVAVDPKNPIGYIKRGRFKSQDPRLLREAEADFEQAVRLDPGSIPGRIGLVEVFLKTDRAEQAVQMLRQTVERDPLNEYLRQVQVKLYTDLGRMTDAAQACDDAVRVFNKPMGWLIRAYQAWASAGNWDRAAEYAGRVWAERKDSVVAAAYAEALLNNNNVKDAFLVLNSPDVKRDETLALRVIWARVLGKQGRIDEAKGELAKALGKVLEDSPEEAALYMTGINGVWPDQADQIKALAELESAVPLTGFVCLRANEVRLRDKTAHTVGEAALKKLAEGNGSSRLRASAWSVLGSDAYGLGQWEEARDRFSRGLQLEADNIELNNNLAYVLAVKLGKCEEALPMALKSAAGAPQNSGFLDTLGVAQLCAKQCEPAFRTLTQSLQVAKDDGERAPVLIHLSRARLCQGDKMDARRLAGQAEDIINRHAPSRQAYSQDLADLKKAIDSK